MKKLLTLLLLITFYSGYTQNPSEVIGTPIKLNNLIIAEHEFYKFETLEDAEKLCNSLGPDWRLPTYEELNFLFDNRFRIGGFENSFYLSSNQKWNRVYCKAFFDGRNRYFKIIDTKWPTIRFRAVKGFLSNYVSTEHINSNQIIGALSISEFGGFVTAENDFPYLMTWDEARKACLLLGPGWRLPTKSELNRIFFNYNKKTDFGGLDINIYWSSSEYMDNKYWTQSMTEIGEVKAFNKFEKFKVRAVKNYEYGRAEKIIKRVRK